MLPAECPGEGFLSKTNHEGESPMSTHVTSHTRLRLTRRGRRVLVALVVIPMVLAIVWAALSGDGANANSTAFGNTLTYVTVNSDESLWQIAQREAPDADVRTYVDAIISLNHLTGEIQPGQRIALPAHV